MAKYRVNVNGTMYEIEVEKIEESEVRAEASVQKTAAAAQAAPAGGEPVKAPMPGNILAVKVQNGTKVKAGDILMILEAMKMENEIMAPVDGVVNGLSVQAGQSVETGKLLCTVA